MSDRYQEEVFREFFREAMESGGALIATDARDGRVIGSSRFHGYDEAKSEIEIGWTFLARSCWGGTYNKEMKRLMLDPCLHVREARGVPGRPTEFPLPAGDGKDRRRSSGVEGQIKCGRESVVFQISAPIS